MFEFGSWHNVVTPLYALRPFLSHLRRLASTFAGMSGRTANEPLDEQIRDEDIEKIAGEYLSNWEKLRPHLKLSQVQEMEIRRTYGDYRDQKRAFLYRWKEKEGSGATYSAFIDAAKIASNRQLAENVTTMLQERLRQTSAPSTEGRCCTAKNFGVCALLLCQGITL